MIVSQAVHNSIEYQKANSKANPDENDVVDAENDFKRSEGYLCQPYLRIE